MIELADLEKYNIEERLYEKFRGACNVDSDLSIVAWTTSKTNLNGQPFGFAGYEYLIEPMEDLYPRQVIIKPAQVGASEIMARKMFAILYRYGLTPHYYEENGQERCVWGISGIYSFPDYDSLRKFSKDRIVTDIVRASGTLSGAAQQSGSESIDQIGIFDSYLYMLGRKSDSSNQSIPAEIIMVDEADRPLSGDVRIRTALNARTQNARIFGNTFFRGMIINYGTPTYPDETGVLLDGMYFLSDQKRFQVKCSRCNHWQEIKYPESIANFYDKGQKSKKEPYWMCLKCKRRLDWSEIGKWSPADPKKVHNAEWIAKYPKRTEKGDGLRGYRIPFATARNTAQKLLMRRDTDFKAAVTDFYNYGLGMAYRDNAIGLSEEDFTKCRTDEVKWGVYDPSTQYIFGIDQGVYIVVAGLKEGSQTDINPIGVWRVVWAEHIKDIDAFSKIAKEPGTGNLSIKKGELAKRIEYWNPDVIVMDHLPNAASAEAEAEIFKEAMWLCDSKGNVGMNRIKFDDEDAQGNIVHKIVEHKHLALDEYFQQIRQHRWEYPLNAEGDQFDVFKNHHKQIKKVVNTEKGTFTYESFGSDHYGQAGKLCSEAAEIFTTFGSGRSKRANILLVTGFQSRRTT